MKKNNLAVAFLAVAFLFPGHSFADTAKVGDITWGFRTDKRLNDMTSLWEPKQIGILDKKTGITHITTITKVACVLDQCLYRTEYQGSKGKKQEMQVFDIEDVLPSNSGNKKISMGDKDVADNAKKLGVDKEKLKKALEDENEYQRLLREIQVKKEQQRRQEEEKKKNQNNGTTGNGGGGGSHGGGGSSGGGSSGGAGSSAGGGSSGGGGSHGGSGSSGTGGKGGTGSKKLENIYVNEMTGAISDTYEGACSGTDKNGWAMRMVEHTSGGLFCQVYEPDGNGGRSLGSAPIERERVSSQEGDCGPGSNMTFGKKSNGTFSVVCTYKHKPKDESSSVGSTGSSSSSDKQNGEASSPNGSSAGGGGGGGRSGTDHATTPDGGMQGGGSNGGSGQGGTTGGSGQGGTNGGSGQGGATGGSGQGGASGSGGGGGGQDSELPEVPDSPFGNGDGEPDWGGLKSNGDFGTFRPSSAFSTGGACPQDLTLDFGQFGVHQLPMSYVCMAVEKLRYVFIFMAYFISAMLVFKAFSGRG